MNAGRKRLQLQQRTCLSVVAETRVSLKLFKAVISQAKKQPILQQRVTRSACDKHCTKHFY